MIGSIQKAARILHLFHPGEPTLSVTEISKRMGIPKSTAHNILNTLLAEGFIEKTDYNTYALGTGLIPLTQNVRVNIELRDRAAPLLRQLTEHFRDSIYLAALDDDKALYIYAVESPTRLLARTAVGDRAHLHSTGIGKAMMAYLNREQVHSIADKFGLPAMTENTITDLSTLEEELAEIRERGYSLDRGENENAVYCIGAPIFNTRGDVIGACSLSSTSESILSENLREYARHLVLTAQEISRRMGFIPSAVSFYNTNL